ncbi:hypothetical protein [Oceanobacillus sp. 1P07AA]|uniref:hypothetical protein n=1 Tax=Oceanobacillus sp. 1P07AA TaxID=3132293 RepID=UPI0039A6753C
MAVRTQIVSCDVCNTKTLVKFQVGILNQYPVHYSCPECLTNIYGEIYINQEEGGIEFKLNNATYEFEGEEEYILVLSGEFPSIKIIKSTEETYRAALFSPFIRYSPHSEEEMNKYQILFNFLPEFIDYEWKLIERVAHLYFNGKDEYIENEVNKLRESSKLTMGPFEKVSSVNKIITAVFRELSSKEPLIDSQMKSLPDKLDSISQKNSTNFLELIDFYTREDLVKLQKELFSLFNTFINHYRYIVPVIYLEAIGRNIEDIKFHEGLNNVSFERLDRLYQNAYETLLQNSTLPLLLDNLIVRGSINSMNASIKVRKKPVKNIQDFQSLTNGQKLTYLSDNNNVLSKIYQEALDTKLRNPIGHNNYSYDSNSQLITFHSNYENQGPKQLYLIEFAYKCFKSMKISLIVWDLSVLISKLIKEKD